MNTQTFCLIPLVEKLDIIYFSRYMQLAENIQNC